jgi:hypothetical protein
VDKESAQYNFDSKEKDDVERHMNFEPTYESGYVGQAHEEIEEVKTVAKAPSQAKDEVVLGDYSVTPEKVHQPQSYHEIVTSSDVKVQETAMTPSAGLASVSVFLTLAALLFALCAIAVGTYNHKKPQITKRS